MLLGQCKNACMLLEWNKTSVEAYLFQSWYHKSYLCFTSFLHMHTIIVFTNLVLEHWKLFFMPLAIVLTFKVACCACNSEISCFITLVGARKSRGPRCISKFLKELESLICNLSFNAENLDLQLSGRIL